MSLDTLLLVAFVAGLLGSTHCLGMCGAIVVLLEAEKPAARHLDSIARRVSYNVGRLSFYTVPGALAGASGTMLTAVLGVDLALTLLRILAALLVVGLGVSLMLRLPVLEFLERGGAKLWRLLNPLLRHVLPVSTPAKAIAAGFLWGALPCGLVYSAVAIAATSGSAASGALVMVAFWLGTMPALLAAGTSAQYLKRYLMHPPARRIAGAALIAVGMLALALPFVHGDDPSSGDHHHLAQSPPQGS